MTSRSSFTLIELLIVIAIVAVLAVVVVMTLNPVQLLKKARDSTRLSDLATINKALTIYQTDQISGNLGSSSVIYLSIPDPRATTTAGTDCQGAGFPASSLPQGWSWHCPASSTLKNTDGMGWIPVNFSSVSAGSPISNLPIDPINTTSSGKYYAYTVGSSTPSVWLVSSYPESQQYKTTTAPQGFQGAFMAGNDYTISPLYNMQGILGWWKFDETSGTVAYDSSGSGNNGTLMNGAGWGSGYVNTNLGGATTNQYISASDVPISSGDITIVALAKVNSLSLSHYGCFAMKSTNQYRPYTEWGLCYTSATLEARRNISYAVSSVAVLTGDFHQYAAVFTSSSTLFYRDGLLLQTTTALSSGTYGGSVKFAGWGSPDNYVDGSLGDLRIYNRALSGAEIQAIYNSAK